MHCLSWTALPVIYFAYVAARKIKQRLAIFIKGNTQKGICHITPHSVALFNGFERD
jgi:hypothetical protein